MASQLDHAVARRYRQLAEAACPGAVQEVRIFGSRARDEAHDESDLDLFVLVRDPDPETRNRLIGLAYDVWNELDPPYSVAPLIMHTAHFERLLKLERRIALDIMREGIPV